MSELPQQAGGYPVEFSMKKSTIEQIIGVSAQLGGWLLSILMLSLIVDFVSRGIFMPVPGVGEVSVFVMVVCVYMGIAYCEQLKGHVKVELIISRFPPRLRGMINLFNYFMILLIVAIVSYAACQSALYSYHVKEAVAGHIPLPVYPVKFAIVIGVVLYWVQLLLNTAEEFRGLRART